MILSFAVSLRKYRNNTIMGVHLVMKNVVLMFIVLVLIVFGIFYLFTHSGDGALQTREASGDITPNVTRYGNNNYFYLVDNNTGVVYLEYSSYYQHGITVMLNADGTPVTKDQLGLKP